MVDHITVSEARRRLGISKAKMARLIEEGVLQTQNNALDKRSKLVSAAAVDALRVTGIAAGPKSEAA